MLIVSITIVPDIKITCPSPVSFGDASGVVGVPDDEQPITKENDNKKQAITPGLYFMIQPP